MQLSTWGWVSWIRMNSHACYASWHFRPITDLLFGLATPRDDMAAGTTLILGCHDCKLTGAVSFGGAARVGSARVAAVYIKASILVSAGLGKLGESAARVIWFSLPASVVLLMSQANCRCNKFSCTLHGSRCTFSRVTSCDVMSKVKQL